MRTAAGVAIAALVTASGAAAQTLAPKSDRIALHDAVFAWKAAEVALPAAPDARAQSSIRIQSAETLRTPVGVFDPHAYDVTLIHSWPRALSLDTKAFEFAVSPHAGVGFGAKGATSAQAGARVELSPHPRQDRAVERLRDLGVGEGARFGREGRWYLFAAADGRAVGLNMLHGETGWDRAGWTTDATGALVGDAQVGVGWRKGDAQSSFGVIHREVRGNHMVFGQMTRQDTVAAFTFSIKPTH
jgi:hypothetical protein